MLTAAALSLSVYTSSKKSFGFLFFDLFASSGDFILIDKSI